MSEEITRRDFLKYLGVGVGTAILGAAGGYFYRESLIPPPPLPPSKNLKIGCIYPITGKWGDYGTSCSIGAQLGAKIINEELDLEFVGASNEGIQSMRGAKIELFISDSEAKPEVAIAEMERLVTEVGCVAIAGAWASSHTFGIMPIAEREHIPVISAGTDSRLATSDFNYFHRSGVTGKIQTETIIKAIDHFTQTEGWDNNSIGIMVKDHAAALERTDVLKPLAADRDWDELYYVVVPMESPDASSEGVRMAEENPDICYEAITPDQAILLFQQWKSMNFTPKIFWAQNMGAEAVVQAIGEDTNYGINDVPWSPMMVTARPDITKVNDMFRQTRGWDLDLHAIREINTILAFAKAAEIAASDDPSGDEIHDALKQVDIPPEGNVSFYGTKFDENGNNIYARTLVTQTYEGKFEIIYPTEVATIKPVFPFPGWGVKVPPERVT